MGGRSEGGIDMRLNFSLAAVSDPTGPHVAGFQLLCILATLIGAMLRERLKAFSAGHNLCIPLVRLAYFDSHPFLHHMFCGLPGGLPSWGSNANPQDAICAFGRHTSSQSDMRCAHHWNG